MKLASLVAVVVCAFLTSSFALASTINVPKDQPTIQAGIDAANNGDTVLVAPGTYKENIDFKGKAISVKSSCGPQRTTIDGGVLASVVVFATNEDSDSTLSGFTIRNGMASFETEYEGGGIYIYGASPTITHNIIQKNSAGSGGGVSVLSGFFPAHPLIRENTIRGNSAQFGGGLSIRSPARIIGNRIYDNDGTSDAGGLILDNAGSAVIMNNRIHHNSAGSGKGSGGGMLVQNAFSGTIVQNLFYENFGKQGGGLDIEIPCCHIVSTVVNNTIIGGSGVTDGSAVWVGGYDNTVRFYNNLMIGLSDQNAVDCTTGHRPPPFFNNDAYSPKGTGFAGNCAREGNLNGNISKNPRFVDPAKRNYQLRKGSPAINAGSNSAPHLPKKDLAGHKRIVGGTIDMGAYEYQGK